MFKTLLLTLGSMLTLQAYAQSPQLLKDINTNTASATPDDITYISGVAYFIADDGIHGRELWKSDGTESGTMLVKDIYEGPSFGFEEKENFTLFNYQGTLYFMARNAKYGYELWKSNGTAASTVMVKNMNTDNADFNSSFISEFVAFNTSLYFVVERLNITTNQNIKTLWKTDGTTSGTIQAIGTGDFSTITNLTIFNNKLYFNGNSSLRSYDGSTLEEIYNKSTSNLTVSGSKLFFVTNDGTTGSEVWKTDGTSANTSLLKDIYPGLASSVKPNSLTDVKGTLYFKHTGNDGNEELWKSDGTTAGTMIVKKINPSEYEGSKIDALTVVDDTLYFIASADGTTTGKQLWKTDGTEIGTIAITGETYQYPELVTNINNVLYFTATGQSGQRSLWKVNPIDGVAIKVKTIDQRDQAKFSMFAPFGSNLIFGASDEVHGMELWKSDGTEIGTVLVKDVNTSGYGSSPRNITKADDKVFFTVGEDLSNNLWITDGTTVGTQLVTPTVSLYFGPAGSKNMVAIGNTAYFAVKKTGTEKGLWKSDGTAAGTVLVKTFNATSEEAPHGFAEVNGTLFFVADDGTGVSLWKSDGTESGTVKIILTTVSPGPTNLFAFNNTLFFTNDDGIHGTELWKSDGTTAGTVIVKDIYLGGGSGKSSAPSFFTTFQGSLYFSAKSLTGTSIWKSDGTEAGTIQVTNFSNSLNKANPQYLTVAGNILFFTAYDQSNGMALWKNDGTAAGTVMVKDIHPGQTETSGELQNLFNVNGKLYFTANDGPNGVELWTSDGTEQGTTMLKNINPNGNSSPSDFATSDNLLYFTANNGTIGFELWVTDGTTTGTQLLSDIYPEAYNSSPGRKVIFNRKMIFGATTHLGKELWAYALPMLPATAANSSITIKEDQVYIFAAADFNSGSAEDLLQVKITAIPTKGSFFLDSNGNRTLDDGEAVQAAAEIAATAIPQLTFVANANEHGNSYTGFRFAVSNEAGYSAEDYAMNIHVQPVADVPSITAASTTYNTFNSEGLVISRNEADDTVSYYKITSITNGKLYLQDGTTEVQAHTLISSAEGAAGLKFKPTVVAEGSFEVYAALSSNGEGLSEAAATAMITIGKASQTITFPAPAQAVLNQSMTLEATASSGLAVIYTFTGPATLNGNVLTPTDTGAFTVTASQAGNDLYQAAAQDTISFTVLSETGGGETPGEEEPPTGGETPPTSGENPGEEPPTSEETPGSEEQPGGEVTGIDESTELADGPVAYPNPTVGSVYIRLDAAQWKGATVILTDILGRTIASQTVKSDVVSFQMAGQHAGAYFIILKKGGQSKVLRILKK